VSTKQASDFVAVRCIPCAGAGHFPDNALCKACHREGFIILSGAIEEYSDCNGCAGSGYLGFDYHTLCKRCDGVGALREATR
jgi:DnaJ-class molecular chaperone